MSDNEWAEEGEIPTPEQFKRLLIEQRDDTAQRPMWEKGVRYEDEYNRVLDEAVERGKFRRQSHERDRGQER